MSKALVVLSGGQDSVTCLGLAIGQHEEVHAIGFSYGQRHAIELGCASDICLRYNVPFKVVDLNLLKEVTTSALFADSEKNVTGTHERLTNLPSTFVPNRNALFLTVAHAYAQTIEADTIYTGVCETDYSGYPDCRADFIQRLETTLNLGYQTNIKIKTPLMYLTKAETFAMAMRCDFLEEVLESSHTCYVGNRTLKHDWGYGCGECPACVLRANGFTDFMLRYNV